MGIIFICLGLIPIIIGTILYAATKEIMVFVVTIILGAIFIIMGTIFLAINGKKKKRIAKIVSEGICIETKVYEKKINYGIKINHHTPYTIYSSYMDEDGIEHKFVSKYISSIKRSSMGVLVGNSPKIEVGDIVKVYVMKDSFDDYIFEVNI